MYTVTFFADNQQLVYRDIPARSCADARRKLLQLLATELKVSKAIAAKVPWSAFQQAE